MKTMSSMAKEVEAPPRAAISRLRLPEFVGDVQAAPTGRPPRYLTAIYASLSTSFSGTTWYMAQAGIDAHILEGAFTLNTEKKINKLLHPAGALWKAQRMLRQRKHGGFKFKEAFHNILWSQHLDEFEDATIVNNTQLFGSVFLRGYAKRRIRPCFYIDGTLEEYFHAYGAVEDLGIGEDVMAEAIAQERESYRHAERIITMNRACARHLIAAYGVPENRVAVVVPGANLDDAFVPTPSSHRGWIGEEFTLGFVGLYAQRKGLDRLASAVRILRGRGLPIRLRIIGRCPPEIASMDGVEYAGVISKHVEPERFVEAIRTVDLGCLLSRAELAGMATLEFVRVGVPVLMTDVGGLPDVAEGGGGLLLPVDVGPEQVAETLQRLMQDSAGYEKLRQAAIARAEWASWRRVVREFDTALSTAGL